MVQTAQAEGGRASVTPTTERTGERPALTATATVGASSPRSDSLKPSGS